MSMKLNPDKEELTRIALEIKNNDGYCPCMLIKSEDTKCPCKDRREKEICICGLYIND